MERRGVCIRRKVCRSELLLLYGRRTLDKRSLCCQNSAVTTRDPQFCLLKVLLHNAAVAQYLSLTTRTGGPLSVAPEYRPKYPQWERNQIMCCPEAQTSTDMILPRLTLYGGTNPLGDTFSPFSSWES